MPQANRERRKYHRCSAGELMKISGDSSVFGGARAADGLGRGEGEPVRPVRRRGLLNAGTPFRSASWSDLTTPDKVIRDLRPAPFPYADKSPDKTIRGHDIRHLRREGGARAAMALPIAKGGFRSDCWSDLTPGSRQKHSGPSAFTARFAKARAPSAVGEGVPLS